MCARRSMTHNDDSTMAASEAAGAPFKEVECKNKSKRLKPTTEQKIAVNRTYNYTIRITFPAPRAKAKFNPLTNTRLFFQEMLKHDSSITVTSHTDSKQIALATNAIPTNEDEFNKFFTVSTDTRGIDNKSHVIIGCHLASDRTLKEIKFDSTSTTQFIDWLKKERIFAESDSLGVTRTATIGYLTKIHTRLTNRTTLKELIIDSFQDVHIDPDIACELDPSLQIQQTDAMTNGDVFVPAPPPFEIYPTEISYGRDKTRVKTDVLGIKCAIDQARLLKEFFSQRGNPMALETRTGVFIPSGTVHIVGPEAYTNLLCDNNLYLQNIATVPIGDFQHETLDLPFPIEANTDIDTTTISDLIMEQDWCISLERSTTKNKVIVVTTKIQLKAAREWVDTQLPLIYEQNIADKIDITTLQRLTPRRLDKPILTAASATYAEQLIKRTSYATNTTKNNKPLTRPPRARPTKLLVSFDDKEFPPLQKKQHAQIQTTQQSHTTTATSTASASEYDYRAELDRLTKELETTMQTKFEHAIAQLDAKFTQRLDQLEQKFEHYLRQMEPIAKFPATLQTAQDNQARDISKLTNIVANLNQKFEAILDRILTLQTVATSPTLLRSVGQS